MAAQIALALPDPRLQLQEGGLYLSPWGGGLSRLDSLDATGAWFLKLTGKGRGSAWSASTRGLELMDLVPFAGELGALRVVLVGCSKVKRPDRYSLARDLYEPSALYRAARGYAEASALPWAILSARYGLLEPWMNTDPYDEALADKPAAERAAWGVRVADDLRRGWRGLAVVEVHAGAPYVDALAAALEGSPIRVEAPLAGLEIGMRKRWYAQNNPRPVAA